MLEDSDWEQVARDGEALPEGIGKRLVAAVLDLHEALLEVQASSQASARKHALDMAREFVSALPSEQKNERGYRDHALRPVERISEELRVARYLLDGQ